MFRKRQPQEPVPPPRAPDWSSIEVVRGEWPQGAVNEAVDLQAWRSGMASYDQSDDARGLHHAAESMCEALRHELWGRGILAGGDLPTTVHHVLYATATSATLVRDMSGHTARLMRLALMVTKQRGWQHTEYGGDGLMAGLLREYDFILTMCLDDRAGLDSSLRMFFTTNPIAPPPTDRPSESPPAPAPDVDAPDAVTESTESMERTLAEADAGDPVSQARARALARQMQGCSNEEAFELHEQVAMLGDVESMYDAGCIARELGRRTQAVYWWEQAAQQNSLGAINNLAVQFRLDGDYRTAMRWHARGAELGDIESYPNLVMLARELEDSEAELDWAKRGADAGQWFCQEAYAQKLARGTTDPATLRDVVIPLFESAAERGGSALSMYLAGIVYQFVGEPSNAAVWLRRAAAAGEERAPAKLRELGL